MDCTNCDTPLQPEAQFCSKCGEPTEKRPRQHSRHRHQRPEGSAEGQAKYAELIAQKEESVRSMKRTWRMFLIVALVVMLAAGVALQTTNVALPCVIAALFILLSFGAPDVRLTEEEYYVLPGSRDLQGEHSCIHCGHRGVYRHSPYRTSHTDAECSKCKKPLWRGPKGK
ncbi:putative membrane protein YvbJ [Roseateles asaccharophilus]|uniref:zinc-ribbon domain-containing protein n=1 Tax=Roseateles asaccharophilus TaxID=582607 RepID=UPI003837C38E